jgi:hypothetical protein
VHLGCARALDADEALADGMLLVAGDFDHAPVFDPNDYAALLAARDTYNRLPFHPVPGLTIERHNAS